VHRDRRMAETRIVSAAAVIGTVAGALALRRGRRPVGHAKG
jgi:hypothetical protein